MPPFDFRFFFSDDEPTGSLYCCNCDSKKELHTVSNAACCLKSNVCFAAMFDIDISSFASILLVVGGVKPKTVDLIVVIMKGRLQLLLVDMFLVGMFVCDLESKFDMFEGMFVISPVC